MQVRGLKRHIINANIIDDGSHLMQVRGLKPPAQGGLAGLIFAPHAGAWIETWTCWVVRLKALFAPHAGAWIETYIHIK